MSKNGAIKKIFKKRDMNSLVSLAEGGSPADLASLLKKQQHTSAELFSAIRAALLWDQKENVLLLLKAGADPLQVNEENSQLLSHAAIGGNPELVKLLISLGCDPNHADIHKRTALHGAACSGRTDVVRALINAGANPNCRDNLNRTPLSEAISHNRHEAAMELIRGGEESTSELLKQIHTPLMIAVSEGSVDHLRRLLAQGCSTEDKDAEGLTPLMLAAKSGKVKIVKLLLDAGANINAADKKGRKAFMWALGASEETALLLVQKTPMSPQKALEALLKAINYDHLKVIEVLLAQKVLIQPEEEGGDSLLERTVDKNLAAVFEMLLHHPATRIDYRSGRFLRTVLITACRKGNTAMSRMLLESGANPAVTDLDGKGPVHHAATAANKEILALLKTYGADLSLPDHRNNSVLHLAVHDPDVRPDPEFQQETVKWLLDQKLQVDIWDNIGMTPLMLAAMKAFSNIVDLLIENGADVNRMDNNGRSALYHAMFFGTDYGINDRYLPPKSIKKDNAAGVISALLEAGADPNLPGILIAARAYRWPGAVDLLKKYGAKE